MASSGKGSSKPANGIWIQVLRPPEKVSNVDDESNAGQPAVLDPTMLDQPQSSRDDNEDSVPCNDFRIKKAFEKVTVAGCPVSCTGKRIYSKPDYCLYCKGKYISKISRHYLTRHTDEKAVLAIIRLAPSSVERKRRMAMLQNEGNHLHNCEVLSKGCGELTVARRPSGPTPSHSRADVYLPCTECKAWLPEKSLSNHSKTCPAGRSNDNNCTRNSKMMISPYLVQEDDDTEIDELCEMMETAQNPGLKAVCKSDVLIREFCRGLLHRMSSHEEQQRKKKQDLRTKLRAVGRLLLCLNKTSEKSLDLAAYITPEHFQFVVKVVKEMGHSSPHLPRSLGHYIKQICLLKRSLALRAENNEEKKEAEDFDILYGAHWKHCFSSDVL